MHPLHIDGVKLHDGQIFLELLPIVSCSRNFYMYRITFDLLPDGSNDVSILGTLTQKTYLYLYLINTSDIMVKQCESLGTKALS